MKASTCLFNHDVDFVSVFHFECFRRVVLLDALAIEDEAALVVAKTLSLAVCIHEFLKLSLLLYLKKDFGSVLRLDLDV